MTILVLSFDFDGCLFNRSYFDNGNIIAANTALFDSLDQQRKENNYSKTILKIGSNRQSFEIDLSNRRCNKTESCFKSIIDVKNRFEGSTFDNFLLADIYGDLPFGTSYTLALDQIANSEKKLDHADYEFDESKVTILYAQIHKIALENPNEEIIFNFYDDKSSIIEALGYFFKDLNPHLMPKNVTLNLYSYKNQELNIEKIIKGKGFIDSNFRQTVKDMTANVNPYSCGNGERNVAYDLDVKKLINRTDSSKIITNEVFGNITNLEQIFSADLIVKKAIVNASNKRFTTEIKDDLLILQKFYQDNKKKIEVSSDPAYHDSLDNFYEKAVEIRLSEKPIKVQAEEILATAEKEFKHRHEYRRLFLDVLMVVSVLFAGLGAVIMIGRACSSSPVFFSSEPTERAKQLNNLIDFEKLNEESQNESSLFKMPQSV